MDQFIVSARKYRPSRFEDVIGQPQVSNTLKNAIKNNQLAQAFLFCGPRGVGKTTCARILAKVINCENITEETEACNECASCKSFNENASFNVHELDAASNNSVDDIRALIDQVRYAPQAGKKKIYIIDEVHMLSQAAFNAFLKTLEEPPPYAIFILATTEKHKIIPTILSRCQIFDFSRIKVDDMQLYLKNIAQRENIITEDDALHLIAQKADGALRDALSIFDRISIFSGNKITYNAVLDNLNILDYDYFFKLTDSFLTSDISTSLLTLNQIFLNGFEGDNFLSGLAEHFRSLLVLQDSSTAILLETSENLKRRYTEQAAYTPNSFLINGIAVINEGEIQYRLARNKRLLTEFILVKLCHLQKAVKLAREQHLEGVKKKVAEPTIENKITTSVHEVANEKKSIPKPVTQVSSETISTPQKVSLNLDFYKTKGEVKQQLLAEKAAEKISFDQITQQQIDYCWDRIREEIKAQGKHVLYGCLNINPVIENGAVMLFSTGEMQQKTLEESREEIGKLLNGYLNTSNILINVILDKSKNTDSQTRKPYTPKEKFDFMVEKNPAIQKLKDDLKLEFDF